MTKIIYLQKIGDIDSGILILLKKNLNWFFKKYNVKIVVLTEELSLLDSEYESNRRQYDGLKIKNRLAALVKKNDYFRVLGVLDVDIYSKFLNFIFGIADLAKNSSSGSALISVTRLKESFYRRSENPAQFEQRVLKEAIHELGHTFGLEHCENPCVMRFSNSLEDTDRKPHELCETCLKKLENYFNYQN
ncbi:MAG: archaemetzincin family Zn-dependent metalloprotease [Candidatus Hermodarchaeota archaeon]